MYSRSVNPICLPAGVLDERLTDDQLRQHDEAAAARRTCNSLSPPSVVGLVG